MVSRILTNAAAYKAAVGNALGVRRKKIAEL
jgi:hypothetical protein